MFHFDVIIKYWSEQAEKTCIFLKARWPEWTIILKSYPLIQKVYYICSVTLKRFMPEDSLHSLLRHNDAEVNSNPFKKRNVAMHNWRKTLNLCGSTRELHDESVLLNSLSVLLLSALLSLLSIYGHKSTVHR